MNESRNSRICDLLIRGGRLVDPASRTDDLRDVSVVDGTIAHIEPGIDPRMARRVFEAAGCIVVPGLVDLHAHVYWGGTALGVDANAIAPESGTTTFVDAGSAGAGNMAGFQRHIIEAALPRILAFLNIGYAGIFGVGPAMNAGELHDPELVNAREAIRAAERFADTIVGIKIRASLSAGCGSLEPVRIARAVSRDLDLPLMVHIGQPPPTLDGILPLLEEGDILTHVFRPPANCLVDRRGRLRPEVQAARERGVRFDVGHGLGSFSFESARRCLDAGLSPDAISTDLHVNNLHGPVFDFATTLSKFLALGMPLSEVLACATSRPADIIGRDGLGRIRTGSCADIAILRDADCETELQAAGGETLLARRRLEPVATVIGGRLYEPAASRSN